ncbi:MAG: fumarylacetoacetate hydrolase family protein [Dehalococcoidales bacterium]|nr:fumarylacetoacetate hydrolase family protein [Dehalococcoidales bacterium]
MKIIRYKIGNQTEYGILEGERVQALDGDPYPQIKKSDRTHQLNDLTLICPCTPTKIVAIGLNYHSHAKEVNLPVPKEPIMFYKPSSAIIGPEENIIYPKDSRHLDYECELGVVIKSQARQVSREEAMKYVLGYTCVNDVSARDWQKSDSQWSRAKGTDTFAPVGPCIETALNPGNVLVETYLNGELKQRASTSDLVFGVPELVSYISQFITLLTGDIIATGTPSGISSMQRGDTVEIKIENIGTLRNYVT